MSIQEPLLTNFEKIQCPFVRRYFKANQEHLMAFLRTNKMRLTYDGLIYLVTPEINPGYEWVLDDPETFAVEKLDGTNVKVRVIDKKIDTVQNRLNPPIDILRIDVDNSRFAEGIFTALKKKYIKSDGEYAGELIGPAVQSNPYKLTVHEWYPFDYAISSLRYKSFDKFERSYDNWSEWFKSNLRSLFFSKRHDCGLANSEFAEGVVFYNLKRKSEGKVWMAKLRRNMFRWFYENVEIEVNPEPSK